MNETVPRYGIYTFYKDHKSQILKFLNSTRDADEIILCNTGSTDGSTDIIEKYVAENPKVNIRIVPVFLSPWRYDDIRNIGLSLMSRSMDLCLCLDIEETLVPEWKAIITDHYHPEISRYQYYIQEEKEGLADIFIESRIHRNGGCFWKYPVYEELIMDNPENVRLIQHVILTKTYRQPEYDIVGLLERYIKEHPSSWIPLWRLAKVLLNRGNYKSAKNALDEALKLNNCDKGKLYGLKAQICLAEGLSEDALLFINKALVYKNEWPLYIQKAQILSELGHHTEAYVNLQKAKRLQQDHQDYPPLIWCNNNSLDSFIGSEKKLALEELSS